MEILLFDFLSSKMKESQGIRVRDPYILVKNRAEVMSTKHEPYNCTVLSAAKTILVVDE